MAALDQVNSEGNPPVENEVGNVAIPIEIGIEQEGSSINEAENDNQQSIEQDA